MFIIVVCSDDVPIIVTVSEYQLDFEVLLLPYRDGILALSVNDSKVFDHKYAVVRIQ